MVEAVRGEGPPAGQSIARIRHSIVERTRHFGSAGALPFRTCESFFVEG